MAGGLLETFYILFESDSSDVKEGADKAKKSTDDLEGSLASSGSEAQLTGKSLGSMAKVAAGALASLVAVSAIKRGIIDTAAEADALGKFSERLNENIESISAWSGAVERSGGTAQGFQSSLESLNEKIVDTAIKGTGELLPFFNQMGISIADANGRARSTLDILPELADSFQNLSAGESAGIGKRLGLDEGTVLLLQKGRGEVEKLLERQRALGVTTREQAEASAKFNDAMADTSRAFSTIGRLLVIEALPYLTDFFDIITDVIVFFKENKNIAVGFFGAIGAVIAAVYLPAILSAAAATLVAISPFLLIGAAIAGVSAAFALVYDDIMAFLSGSESVIGELSKEWPLLGEVIKNFAAGIGLAFEGLGLIFGKLTEYLFSPQNAVKDLIELFGLLVDAIPSFDDLADGVGNLFNSIPGFGSLFGDEDLSSAAPINGAKDFIVASASLPINNATSSSIANSNNSGGDRSVAITGDIIVTPQGGGIDDAAAAQATGDAVQGGIRRAVDNFDDGLMA